ncbi:MAG TPA: prepilin-type N-terminal cleavage/methylation domain-containing protein [Ideonella sp.]|uniref:prepilin-type N-terminal cleavage/methylation domain-containing protein n=1 Tax=Ideonella sp. TaxID=1929293 RepID=UPI002E373289|nr:prepilin-type N-terminal cleavage/methylation domain-containing protein [Ideonella sp.]HEX5683797.1 prepilin-type N-terminal cleavage/methylation domain-containing protein [Ideonella sp.]
MLPNLRALRAVRRRPGGQRGFTLLEAMVAMVVAAFGLMGLVGMQMTLSRGADVAKQRGEATRLAQERIEAMRAFTAIDATEGQLSWSELAGDTDEATTNVNFTRTVTLEGELTDPMRFAQVSVDWTDRADEQHSVVLRSVVSRTDPADVGALGFPLPQNTTLKRPKNRSLNIPIPATDMGNGKSVYQLANNLAVVFSNDTGYVVQKCEFQVTMASQLDQCESYDAYILAGYVSKTMSSFPASLGVNTQSLSGYDSAREIDCSFGDAVDQNSGRAIAGYKYYLCIIPVVTDGTWSGTLRLSGMAAGTDYLVCRMQFPTAAGLSDNARNVQPYDQVDDSLDNQNYVITTASRCPTVSSLATTLHQSCRTSNSLRAADCPAS